MGTLQPKGPNPRETDVNSPRYTEASKAATRPTEMGISGDAALLIGKGFEEVFIQSNMEFDIAAGDYAYCGNRVGMVTAVTKNVTTGKVETITVVEDLGALPLDWREDPAGFGYDDNGPSSTTKTTVYAVDPAVAAEVINGGGVLLGKGNILVCRQRTTDPTTWTPEAQAAATFQEKQKPKAVTIEIPGLKLKRNIGQTAQYTAEILPEEASQEVIWSIDTFGKPGITINQNGLVTISISEAEDDNYNVEVTATSKYNSSVNATVVLQVVEL